MSDHGTRCHRLTVGEAAAPSRLDRFLADNLAELSRARIQGLIRDGRVRNARGTLVDPSARVKPGEEIEVVLPEPEPARPQAEAMALDVVYEDRHLIVIDKPAGLVVHPAAGHRSGTLVNALVAHCGDSLSGIGGVKRPGIVHRLDKDTSGLMVVAKTDEAHQGLAEQFAKHGADGGLTRAYLAVVWGAPPRRRGTIDAPLARSQSKRTKIAVARGKSGRRAVTHFSVERMFVAADGKGTIASLVRVELATGRTHQIRVHFAHIGHPLLGDRTYGAGFAASARRLPPAAQAALVDLGRQALHATHLGFVHPVTGKRLVFDRGPPAELARLIDSLELNQR